MAEKFDFVNTDAQSIYDTVLDCVMEEVNGPLYPGDERRIYTEAVIMVLVSVYNYMNDTAKQKMLQYARGYVLDALGERTDTMRLEPSPAQATFRFSVSALQTSNIVIPAGTRITPDGEIYFATQAATVLTAGDTYVDVLAICTTGGADYNGLVAGSVNVLVDMIPYIAAVENIEATKGGDDGEPYPWEDDGSGDERYRERIRLATSKYSTAGPAAAYKYYALSASPDIAAVEIDIPSANVVDIYALMTGGRVPTEDELQLIADAFPDDVRPMTDIVTVKAPTEQSYDIEITYYCTLDNEAKAVAAVEGSGGAIDLYNAWQTAALGRDINPDQLRAYLKKEDGSTGVERVTITKPEYKALNNKEVAKFSGSVVVSHEIVSS